LGTGSPNPATATSPAYSGLSGDYFFGAMTYNSPYGGTWSANFGQRPFAYTPPTGFLPLHTGNLPDSSIVDGSEYFNPVLYTGNNGSNRAITGVGFAPDLVWLKCRSFAYNHRLVDKLQGVSSTLASNLTSAAVDASSEFNSLDSDGFTITQGSSFEFNANAQTYVTWNWKANGAGVSNTDGSITSTVSANPTAGVSVVTHTGTGGVGTIGHGLGVAPAMFISKNRVNGATNWHVYHQSVGNTKALFLNTTDAAITSVNYFNNTSPTDTVFTLASAINLANTYVTYCFADVEGYSKFGSYTGNGSSDGVFVYLGFRPKWLLIKNTTGYSWILKDTARDTRNVAGRTLVPNESTAESAAGNNPTDFLSNGFKLREGSVSINSNGTTYIYMAFAENPFKNSLAR